MPYEGELFWQKAGRRAEHRHGKDTRLPVGRIAVHDAREATEAGDEARCEDITGFYLIGWGFYT